MLAAFTVYVVADSEGDWQSWSDACANAGATLVRLPRHRLAHELPAALVRGAVVVVVDSDADTKLALSLGADEVLRNVQHSPDEIESTLERARLRASARAMRDRRAIGSGDGDGALALLGSALGEQLVEPLHAATADCQQVTDAVRVLLDISDDLVGWAALSAPAEELRRLAARRLAAPTTSEVRQALLRMQTALTDARFTAGKLRDLVVGSAGDGCLSADRLAVEFGTLVAPHMASVATLEVDASSRCAILVPTSFFLSVAAILVSNALGALRYSGRAAGHISLRTTEADGAAVLTVEDDASEMTVDLSSPAARQGSLRSQGGLAVLRERLLAQGGDMLIQSDSQGTQVRVVFPPTGAQPIAPEPDEPAVDQAASRSRGLN